MKCRKESKNSFAFAQLRVELFDFSVQLSSESIVRQIDVLLFAHIEGKRAKEEKDKLVVGNETFAT